MKFIVSTCKWKQKLTLLKVENVSARLLIVRQLLFQKKFFCLLSIHCRKNRTANYRSCIWPRFFSTCTRDRWLLSSLNTQITILLFDSFSHFKNRIVIGNLQQQSHHIPKNFSDPSIYVASRGLRTTFPILFLNSAYSIIHKSRLINYRKKKYFLSILIFVRVTPLIVQNGDPTDWPRLWNMTSIF